MVKNLFLVTYLRMLVQERYVVHVWRLIVKFPCIQSLSYEILKSVTHTRIRWGRNGSDYG